VFDLCELLPFAQQHWGLSPTNPRARLEEDLQLDKAQILRMVSVLEDSFNIEFPALLIESLESLEDLLHYVSVKVSQVDLEL